MSKQPQPKYSNHYKKAATPQPVNTAKHVAEKITPPPKPVDVSKPVTLVFNATDTLFFRESRPMEALGEAQSVFPPPVRTLAGAVRTLIGEHFEVKWHDFNQKQGEHPLADHIGYGESLGKLSFQGAWLAYNSARLYPAPLHLMKKDEQIFQLELAKTTEAVRCDWGENVRLPKLPSDDARGSKPLENTWLTQAGLAAVLAGKIPSLEKTSKEKPNVKTQVYFAKDLFEQESRLGIARDNATRTVQKSLLYQTQHIRPKAELSIELDVEGLPKDFLKSTAMIRLGGEGRTASLSVQQTDSALPTANISSTKFSLYLLTPLYGSPCLDFHRKKCEPTIWQGELNGIALTLHGAITGKVQRVGGWDMAAGKPRPVKSLVPAGSVFFCSVEDGGDVKAAVKAVIKALHNQRIGAFTEYGYGHLAVGVWNDNETQGNKA